MSSITITKLQENENSLKELNQEECNVYGGFCFESNTFIWNIQAELAPDSALEVTYFESFESGVNENGNNFCTGGFDLSIVYVRQ